MQHWAPRLPRRAAPKHRGSRLPPILSVGPGRFAMQACWGPQPLPYGISAPSQRQPMRCSEP
eukprot:15481326-Alexandrium_andersonii.AAC.1